MANAFGMDEDVIAERTGGAELLTAGGGALAQITKSEVDVQVATAKAYPRDVRKARHEALALATLDEDTAASMIYALPRAGKKIEGPSARLAEIVVYSWGNIRAQAIVTDVTDKHVVALGTCFDLEKNVAAQVQVRRRITNSQGRRFDDDMITVTGNAACSIALRNAVFKVIPFALVKPIYEAAKETAVGRAKSMSERRAAAVEWFGKIGVGEDRLLAVLGKKSMEETTLDDLVALTGLKTAIKDGDTSIEEAFPEPERGTGGKAGELNETVAAAKKGGTGDGQKGKSDGGELPL